jgi:ankyrin repeat protein
LNLLVLPHRFESPQKIVIGIGQGPVQKTDFRPFVAYNELRPTERLVTAAQFGDLHQVIAAVQAGGDINVRDGRGVTALFMAISDIDSGVSKWLLQNGANPNIKNLRGGSPPCVAAIGGNEKAIKLLGRYGADWELEDKADPDCETPRLIWAITNTSSEEFSLRLVRALVEAGANPHVTYQGRSALQHAKQAKYQKVVEYLAEAIAHNNPKTMKSRPTTPD